MMHKFNGLEWQKLRYNRQFQELTSNFLSSAINSKTTMPRDIIFHNEILFNLDQVQILVQGQYFLTEESSGTLWHTS